jgi:alkylhydroperoxidase family enzyme
MARLEYLDEQVRPDLAELVGRIRGERGDRLINLYKLLLHSPPVAEGWLAMGGALRHGTEIDGVVRELAIVRVAILTASDYEYRAHVRHALNEGATDAQLSALEQWSECDLFDDRQRAALRVADAMTTQIEVEPADYADLAQHFTPREQLELVVNIAFYNMVSRVLAAVDIDPETELPRLTRPD